MKRINSFLALFIISILFTSCIRETSTDPNENLVKIQTDIQTGFEGQNVTVVYNGEISFNAILSEYAPLAGPLSNFLTYLPRGKNRIEIYWGQNYPFQKDSSQFLIGELDKYFIGISLYEGEISIDIRENPFLYL